MYTQRSCTGRRGSNRERGITTARQHPLGGGYLVTGRHHGSLGTGNGPQGEETFAPVGRQRRQRQGEASLAAGSYIGQSYLAAGLAEAITLHTPAQQVAAQGDEVVTVGHADVACSEGEGFEVDGLQHPLHFVEVWMGRTVSSQQAVGAEVGVVHHAYKAHVASVGPDVVALLVMGGKGLVYPVPDEAALQLVVAVDEVPVVLQIAYAVAHGVGILAEDEGTRVALVHMAAQGPDAGIHGAVNVALGIVATPFVLHGTGGVGGMGQVIEGLEMTAITALVAHAPGDDGGEVAVACYHAFHALAEGQLPLRLVGQRTPGMVFHAVTLDVGFVHQVEAVLRAEFVPGGIVGIVAVAYGIQVVLLHQADICQHGGHIDGASLVGVVLVTVHATKQHRLSVDELHTVLHLHRTKAE